MATQKSPKGRPASPLQREFAAEILANYKNSEPKNHSLLIQAIEHFSLTGDFSPFSSKNQELKKRAIFHGVQAYAKNLKGKELEEFAYDLAVKYDFSEETAMRMLKGKTNSSAVLTGADGLLLFLENKLAASPRRKT